MYGQYINKSSAFARRETPRRSRIIHATNRLLSLPSHFLGFLCICVCFKLIKLSETCEDILRLLKVIVIVQSQTIATHESMSSTIGFTVCVVGLGSRCVSGRRARRVGTR